MNEPIINPLIFYVGYLSHASLFIVFVAAIVLAFMLAANRDAQNDVARTRTMVTNTREDLAYHADDGKTMRWIKQNRLNELEESLTEREEVAQRVAQSLQKTIIITAAIFMTWILIPNEETIYRMAVASYVTPHNIQITGETVEKIIDKTVEKILTVKEEKK